MRQAFSPANKVKPRSQSNRTSAAAMQAHNTPWCHLRINITDANEARDDICMSNWRWTE